jgi:DNA adenine methylase
VIYCDPPYLGRHADYFDSWSEEDERDLAGLLADTHARFVISTWHSNQYRHNASLDKYWAGFTTLTREHFYHVGAKEKNRNPMLEALVMNFEPTAAVESSLSSDETEQLVLMERPSRYRTAAPAPSRRRPAAK